MGGIRDSVAGRRVTSAFMSLSNSSSWFRTGARATEKEEQEKGGKREMEPEKVTVRWTSPVRKRGHRRERTTDQVTKMTGSRQKKSDSEEESFRPDTTQDRWE